MRQALSYRGFADSVFIVMPASRLADTTCEFAATQGVGVLAAHADRIEELVPARTVSAYDPRVRRLVGETVLAQHLGQHSARLAGEPAGGAKSDTQ
jgi:hypothetical protein